MEQVDLVKVREPVSIATTQESQPSKFLVSSGLLAVLKAEGAHGELFTKKEIMGYLRVYICNRSLFDNDDPTLIHCENDPLGSALGVQRFTIGEAMTLLSAKVRLATPTQKGHETSFMDNIVVGVKRRSDDFESEHTVKRHCVGTVDPKPGTIARSPIYIDIHEAPDYDSSPETVFSYQGYETALPKDTTESSDDLWFLETEEEYEVEIEADTFEVEYEVNSLGKSSDPEDDDDTDTESEVAEMVGAAAILVCQDDSDVEFWADGDSDSVIEEHSTSESDPEITDGDKWKCVGCLAFNRPLLRFCQKCWRLRSDWLPDRRRRWPQRKNRRRRSRHRAQLARTLSAPGDGEVSRTERLAGLRRRRLGRTSRSLPDVSANDEFGIDDDVAAASPIDGEPTAATMTTVDSSGVKSGDDGSNADVTSSDATSPTASTAASTSLCSICLSRPKNASIVHGKIGHQTCCYTCGKKLWARNKPCPICRRTIQKVIQNYIV